MPLFPEFHQFRQLHSFNSINSSGFKISINSNKSISCYHPNPMIQLFQQYSQVRCYCSTKFKDSISTIDSICFITAMISINQLTFLPCFNAINSMSLIQSLNTTLLIPSIQFQLHQIHQYNYLYCFKPQNPAVWRMPLYKYEFKWVPLDSEF